MTDREMERLRDEALLDKTPRRREPGRAADRIAPYEEPAAYDETAAEVGNERNIFVGDDPGIPDSDEDGGFAGRGPYIQDRDEIAPS